MEKGCKELAWAGSAPPRLVYLYRPKSLLCYGIGADQERSQCGRLEDFVGRSRFSYVGQGDSGDAPTRNLDNEREKEIMEFFDAVVTEQAKQNVMEILNSGRLSEGEWVRRFEQELEKQFGYRNCVAVNSGTSALHLALLLAGVGQGDEVILTAQTFVATGLAVLYCGAKPVFADIERDGNIDPREVHRKITSKTRAIICVSWGGQPCQLDRLKDVCIRYGLKLIQDNAQAFGATYYGLSLTEWGDFSCFSFQAIKHLTTGDGGLLVSKTSAGKYYGDRLRWFGISRTEDNVDYTGERQYNLSQMGYKYHMNDYAAALGLGNLSVAQENILNRRGIAAKYDYSIPEEYRIERNPGGSYWLYDLLVEKRSDFIRMMKSKNIPVSVVHVGIDRNDVFGGKVMNNVNQRYWDEHHICIPCHSSLTDEDVQRVIDAVRGGW